MGIPGNLSIAQSLKATIRQAMRGSVLYGPMRNAYQRMFNRKYWSRRKRMESFFAQFINKKDLVFDVGANVGEYTEVFLRLGARVVAVEPNPKLASALQSMRPFDRVTVESVAIGSAEGTAEFHMASYDTLSTLSTEWLTIAQNTKRFSGMEWNEKIVVQVSTLDALIERHGMPQFIKIDVEGFEREVLAGLSQASKYLTFEFNTEFIDAAVESLNAKCFPAGTEFNLTIGSQMDYASQWMERSQMVKHLQTLTGMQTNGDIIARRA